MPRRSFGKDISRGVITKTNWRATVTIICADVIPEGTTSPLFFKIEEATGEGGAAVELTLRKRIDSATGEIRFNTADGSTQQSFRGATSVLLNLFGRSATSGGAADVMLDVRIEGELKGSVEISVGPPTTTVAIRKVDGTSTPEAFAVTNGPFRLKAVPTPAGAGDFFWFSVNSSVLALDAGSTTDTVKARLIGPGASTLGVLFTPAGGPAAMSIHLISPWVANPEVTGPFPVGRMTYTEPSFTIPAGLEDVTTDIEVTLEALVRYPATAAGDNQPVAAARPTYPLVILAHGRHSPVEVHRDAAGDPTGAGLIRDGAGNLVEFKNFEGLEYLAAHLASHGFIAVSINLNGRFDNVTGVGQLVEPASVLQSCKPSVFTEAGIAHRGLTVLRHIDVMETKNASDPILTGRIDLDNIALIGHSRGGEAVAKASEINQSMPPGIQAAIRAVISIAPTDFRHIELNVPYLAILGSNDEDVIDGGGLRLYDRADPPKCLIWVIDAIHNFFSSNWHWQDEVSSLPSVSRAQHEAIAKGYCNIFLHEHIFKTVAGLTAYLTGERQIAAVSAVEMHHSIQLPGGLNIDNFEDVPADKTHNSLGNLVADTSLHAFNESPFDRHTGTLLAPGAITLAAVTSSTVSLSGCVIARPSWFHDTLGLFVEWDNVSAVYESRLAGLSATDFDVLSFRVAQDIAVNTAGANQDFKVTLTDTAGAQASIRVSTVTTIPYPKQKQLTLRNSLGVVLGTVDFTKSVLKTVRIPLASFTTANPALDLNVLQALRLEFSERPGGKLGFDDFEFTR